VTTLVGCQRQADVVYINLSSEFYLAPHTPIIYKLSDFVRPGGYINWFHSFLTNRRFQVLLLGLLILLLKYSPVFFEDLFWGVQYLICLLTTYLMQFIILGIYISDVTKIYRAINSPNIVIYYILLFIPHVVDASLMV
jgi:hypothetical protein